MRLKSRAHIEGNKEQSFWEFEFVTDGNVWSKPGCQTLPMPWLKRPISTIGSLWWLSMAWKGVLFPTIPTEEKVDDYWAK